MRNSNIEGPVTVDVLLIGAGIMSATLGMLLKQLKHELSIQNLKGLMWLRPKAQMPEIMQEPDILHFAN